MLFAYLCATVKYNKDKGGGKKQVLCVIPPHHPSCLSLIASIVYLHLL